MDKELFRIDRSAISVTSLNDDDSDLQYWLSKTAIERLQAVELLRQLMYNYDPATTRLQRVFETAEFKTN